eukprot:6101869-Pyramimonas_sp.AAC.1
MIDEQPMPTWGVTATAALHPTSHANQQTRALQQTSSRRDNRASHEACRFTKTRHGRAATIS